MPDTTSASLKIDLTQLDQFADRLSLITPNEMNRMLCNSLVKVARELKQETENQMRIQWGDTVTKGIHPMIDNVIMVKHPEDANVKVHIAKGYTRWYEMGTDERFTKKGYYRGQIIGRPFFKTAQDSVLSHADDVVGKEMIKYLNQMLQQ